MTLSRSVVEVPEDLLDRLVKARALTDKLFAVVRPEALCDRPIAERHRIIFYIGHLEAFDWNLLAPRALNLPAFHPEFDRLFAFGIDPVGGGLPTDQPSDWPAMAAVYKYCDLVREKVDAELGNGIGEDPSTKALLLNVAIEHRLMHAETLAYMLHQLPFDRKLPETAWPASRSRPAFHRMIEIPEGTATLGLARGVEGVFGWDNEFEEHSVVVPAFAIDACNVTNRDFLKFVLEGGYEERCLWSAAGWEWITKQEIQQPRFWTRRDDSWFYRTMFNEVPLPLDWPVYVSHAEAEAYARWAEKALPTEARFQRAAFGTPAGVERAYPWGEEAPNSHHGNFDFQRWDPVAVGSYPEGRSAFGVEDLVGNGWEWTSTVFEPFPGFEPFPFYRGYSADFFDGKHYVIKGGSPRTAACMLRRTFRNWFQPHYPYVYATFRCVSN